MATPLLQTKLYIPPPRPERVPRPRLIERLNAGLHRKLTLISAPAGFGKTTLVSEWMADLGRREPKVHATWLSLDEADNDPNLFLTYLVAALQAVEHSAGKGVLSALKASGLQSPQPPPTEAILTSLINEIAALPNRIVLVLDDYHLLDVASPASAPVHDALTFLLRHLPSTGQPSGGLHLVIATREDPALPLARLRARGQLTELRATDLRFTSAEAAEFLNQAMGLGLAPEDIAALETRTEGWIAGLQLASLALQGPSMQGRKDVAGFIQSFTGSHRFVLDYLVEEVLEQQPKDVQTFLLHTSILDRMCGPLCDALRFGGTKSPGETRLPSHSDGTAVQSGISGLPGSAATLERLDRANLFIVPLDGERRWYRYHHLFADLLRQRVHRQRPDLVPELHRRASAWYRENGLVPEAVNHALAASDLQQAAELIGQAAWAMLMRGEVNTLLRWQQALPDEIVLSHSDLAMLHAWILALMGELDDADSWLSNVHIPCGRGEMAAIRGYIAHHRQQTTKAIERCQEALELLPDEQWFPRGAAAMVLGMALLRKGDPVAACQTLSNAIEIGRTANQIYLTTVAVSGLGEAQEMQGHLRQAIQTYQQALQLAAEYASEPMPFAGVAYVGLAKPLYERDDLAEAMRCVTKGIELSKQARNVDTTEDGHYYLALLYQALGNPDQALEAIRETRRLAQRAGDGIWLATACAFQSQWWLNRGDLATASQCVQECREHAREGADFVHEFAEIAAARVLIAQAYSLDVPQSDEAGEALRSLSRLLQAAETAGRVGSTIKILALQALAFDAQGDMAQAMSALERALSLAEPEGYVRTFVNEGPAMTRLLYQALSRGIAGHGTVAQYARRLLAAFPVAEPERALLSETKAPQSELVEPLSERELEVLQLIAQGLTNPEIASRLFLSLNTIKVHTRNIYGKLGVHSRTQAAARARALGLLFST